MKEISKIFLLVLFFTSCSSRVKMYFNTESSASPLVHDNDSMVYNKESYQNLKFIKKNLTFSVFTLGLAGLQFSYDPIQKLIINDVNVDNIDELGLTIDHTLYSAFVNLAPFVNSSRVVLDYKIVEEKK